MADLSRPRYEVTVVTTAFQITGQIEPIGPWLDFLNAKDKFTLPVHNAHVLAIGTSAGAAQSRVITDLGSGPRSSRKKLLQAFGTTQR